MLVAMSDIHFVDGTAGEHNLPFSAFESVFLADVASLAKKKGAKEIKILLLGDIIDAGFDIISPVQTSAAGMEPRGLKDDFGDRIVFWGGGVETQSTLPFGTPEDVYNEVSGRIRIFNKDGGYVFNAVHNIQPRTPPENIMAMVDAIKDSF